VGEISIAIAAGLAPASILVHGVNKSPQDLHAAVEYAATIVVDNETELCQLLDIVRRSTRLSHHHFPNLWLRLKPGVAVDTHTYTQTGHHESKFGMALDQASGLVETCQENNLPLKGLHFHLGSQFRDSAPLQAALEVVLDFMSFHQMKSGWIPEVLCAGGGWGVPYHEADLPYPSPQEYIKFLAESLQTGCMQRNLPLPRLHLEPGRSLVAQAGVALYRVGAVKPTASRRWLLIDGGLADNPRPALYGARYTALPACEVDRPNADPAWLAGPFCESGDILIESLPLPAINPGEFIAVPVSGAYQLSMASNYNGAMRPAVLWLNQAGAHLIQERETPDHLIFRDRPVTL
jgi:diaminopimelate decarboxylase